MEKGKGARYQGSPHGRSDSAEVQRREVQYPQKGFRQAHGVSQGEQALFRVPDRDGGGRLVCREYRCAERGVAENKP